MNNFQSGANRTQSNKILKHMVIQRWQSVLLFITVVAMAAFSLLSLGQIQLPDFTLDFTALGFYIEGISTNGSASGYYMYTLPLFIVSLMSAIIPLINIFLFRNLRLQKSLCLIGILFILAAVSIGCGYGYCTFAETHVSWSSLIIAPLLAIIATIMAYSRINSDQKMLKAVDRIR